MLKGKTFIWWEKVLQLTRFVYMSVSLSEDVSRYILVRFSSNVNTRLETPGNIKNYHNPDRNPYFITSFRVFAFSALVDKLLVVDIMGFTITCSLSPGRRFLYCFVILWQNEHLSTGLTSFRSLPLELASALAVVVRLFPVPRSLLFVFVQKVSFLFSQYSIFSCPLHWPKQGEAFDRPEEVD